MFTEETKTVSESNLDVIRAWIDAHNVDDIEGELSLWDDDAEITIVPTSRTYRGIAELREAAKMAANSEGDKVMTHLFASDDWACAEYTAHATVHGPMDAHGISIPAGVTKAIELQVCFLANIKDGKIVRAREYWDTGSLMRQLAAS